MVDSWASRKASFNHDWLRNGLLVLLGAVRNVSNGSVENSAVVAQLKQEANQWSERRQEALELINSLENEMSPVFFFQVSPLSNCDEEVLSWLADLVHASWIRRHLIHEQMDSARFAVGNVDTAFHELIGYNSSSIDSIRSLEFSEALNRLSRACIAMANAFGRLPTRILV